MKVSYKWLDEYFDKKLPAVEKIVAVLTMHSQEVEGIEKINDDYVLDVKVLPNMAHHCLSHRGIARELSVLLNLPMKDYSREFKAVVVKKSDLDLLVKIEDQKGCRRYIGRVMENIKILPSPEWLKHRLETLGQRSINNLVDATNFVMLELGQPLHVFDADKISGNTIEVKRAQAGDEIKTLDGKQVILDESVLTISNDSKALAIAGIKGGTVAEINDQTKNIILEAANFDPVLIRKTAQKIKIQTDASKRYENELTPELCGEAMNILVKLILEIASTAETKVGESVDIYPTKFKRNSLGLSVDDIEKVLGLKIREEEIIDILRRFDFIYKKDGKDIIVEIPTERLDLKIREDLIEEIGRVYGYEKLPDKKIKSGEEKGKINKSFYYASQIKKILVENGFSEIYGYAFAEKGEIELANSVALEKKFLRTNLTESLKNYLDFNARYSELIAMPQIKIFEIGKVFKIDDEHNNLILGIKTPLGTKRFKKDSEILNETVEIIEKNLEIKLTKINKEENIFECDFDKIIEKLPEPKDYDLTMPEVDKDMRFKKISAYPFISRDIAVFVPENILPDKVLKIILEEGTDLIVRNRLFDTFKKDGRISYAFRLVFQSYDKTLSDEEINKIMTKIVAKLNTQKDWQVR
jgi:phenylalanyl-tRNA synthetase beta chain